MDLVKITRKRLPILWVLFVEILLAIFAVSFIFNGDYIEGLLCLALIELRESNWLRKK